MKSLLLVGCGNIGFRHLQAISGLDVATRISVVEPNADAHHRIREHFSGEHGAPHSFSLSTSLSQQSTSYDAVVIATTASHRRQVVSEILQFHTVSGMILEKVVAQTADDLEQIGRLVRAADVNAFVNCGRRTFGGYAELKAKIGSRPAQVAVSGAEFGLASNAIHFLDLVEFLNRSMVTQVDLSGLTPGSVASKRSGFVEIYGEIAGRCDNGAEFSILCRTGETTEVEVAVRSEAESWRIDEIRGVVEHDRTSASFSSQRVSDTTSIYRDLLETRDCVLTPFVDSARQHLLFITELRTHLGLSNERDEPCPIS